MIFAHKKNMDHNIWIRIFKYNDKIISFLLYNNKYIVMKNKYIISFIYTIYL